VIISELRVRASASCGVVIIESIAGRAHAEPVASIAGSDLQDHVLHHPHKLIIGPVETALLTGLDLDMHTMSSVHHDVI